ncbi:MAG: SpoIIE family protein phosphatase [Bacteroidales bacterium]|nr:SpoIIE family protein phosphatase [Bacteroidales bacterium]
MRITAYILSIMAMMAAITTAAWAQDDSTLLGYHIYMAQKAADNNNPTEAIQLYFSAIRHIDHIEDRNSQNLEVMRSATHTRGDINMAIGNIYYNRGHYPRAREIYDSTASIYQGIGDTDRYISALRQLASCERLSGLSQKAIIHCEIIKQHSLKHNNPQLYKQTCQNLVDMYIHQAQSETDPSKSRDMMNKASATANELYEYCRNNPQEALSAYNNVAYCDIMSGDYNSAIKKYGELIRQDQASSPDNLDAQAISYTNRGICHQKKGDMKNCYSDLQMASRLRREMGDTANYSRVNNILALIYLKEKDLHNAEIHAREAMKSAQELRNPVLMEDAYETYSEIMKMLNNLDGAIQAKENYMSIRDSLRRQADDIQKNHMSDLQQLQDAEKKSIDNIYQQKIEEKNIALLQSQHDKAEADRKAAEESRRVAELEKDRVLKAYQLQQMQMAALDKERQNQQLIIKHQKAEQERVRREQEQLRTDQLKEFLIVKEQNNNKMQQMTIERGKARTRVMYILLGIMLLVILFFIYFLSLVHRKNKEITSQKENLEQKNEELSQQRKTIEDFANEVVGKNREIENINKSITDSIQYAKRIQESVCAIPDFMHEANIDFFVFFRPKEIVSGDFFWFNRQNNYIFAVAADCTGHGVPGAFMSMLGISLLNKVVAERGITSPELILNNLRNDIKRTLHQYDINASQKDGMDMSLIRIDTQSLELMYSGANNDGYLVQNFGDRESAEAIHPLGTKDIISESDNGTTRLTMMPADLMPIGVYIREKESFTLQKYQLRKGDSVYLTSDGVLDQFGGPSKSKFMKKNFKKMLMEINGKKMEEQKTLLDNTITSWIGTDYFQMDDMVVIGIQI